jgi:hypothetical protein
MSFEGFETIKYVVGFRSEVLGLHHIYATGAFGLCVPSRANHRKRTQFRLWEWGIGDLALKCLNIE